MPGYELRSKGNSESPINADADPLNTTMIEANPSMEAQIWGIVDGLKDLTRAVVESRTDINSLKKQMEEIQVRISSTANVSSERNGISSQYANEASGGEEAPIVNCWENAQQTFHQPPQTQAVYADTMGKLYDLPPFSGNANEWPLFIANFKDTTEFFRYSNRHNLMRLQKCLSGPAKEAVASMLIFPNDVPKVIEELEFRFGRPDILFSTAVRNVVAFLNSADCQHHLISTTLLEEMVSKLPLDQQFEWAKVATGIKPFPTVEIFCDWLGNLARVVSMMSCSSSTQDQNPNKMMVVNKTQNLKPKCEICKEVHSISQCKTFIEEMSVSERLEKVKASKLCFCCLHKGHGSSGCRFKRVCGLNGCQRFHNRLLHEGKTQPTSSTQMLNCRQPQIQQSKLFKVLPVKLHGPSGSLNAYAMFDEGSSISLIKEDTAKSLGLKGKYTDLILQWYGDKVVTEKSFLVNCQIEGTQRQSDKFSLKNLHTVKELNLPTQSFSKSQHPKFSTLPIEDYVDATPVILLGLDNTFLGTPFDVNESDNLVAMQCKLGWFVYGGTGYVCDKPTVLHMKDGTLHNIVQEYISNENFGTCPGISPLLSDNDQIAKEIMDRTTKRIGNRFEIGLLWKKYPPEMPNSFEMALKRLLTIEKKMFQNAEFAVKYKVEIEKYIEKGYARKLSEEEIVETRHPVWYLPHFGVINPNKPQKLRVVFDASAKVGGISLNDLLLKGPEQAKSLLGILLKFRQGKIAVAADIREMFSQIKIRKEDQHSQRFLWRNGESNMPVGHYAMVSMIFGAISSPCCAEYIKNRNATEFAEIYPDAAAIIEKHYVDDFVASFKTETEAIEVCEKVVTVHARAGFELRGFVSNSGALENRMNLGPCGDESKNVNMEKQASADKILGMYWNKTEDVFEFKTKFHNLAEDVFYGVRVPTKRELLKVAMAVFDPFGLIADFLLYSKSLVQQTWKYKIGWDEAIPKELHKKWYSWWKEFEKLKDFKINRCLSPTFFEQEVQLHVFVDASQEAFSAVCYFKIQENVSFVIGKTRCAPIKLLSIPRLELQAAVLGTRLSQVIINNHDIHISKVFFWSDSQTVLQWLNSKERRFKAFVSHRVAEILNSTKCSQWRYVPTQQNPADAGTRTVFPPKLLKNNIWISGRTFLRENESCWPKQEIILSKNAMVDEICASFHLSTAQDKSFIEYERFSSYTKLKRSVAWVLRFAKMTTRSSRTLNGDEIEKAGKTICKLVQSECFKDELKTLYKGSTISKSSPLHSLAPYLDQDGLIRISGRLDEALYLPFDARRPIILPQNHWVSELIMAHYHNKNYHQNKNLTINELRQNYWIPNIKTLYNKAKRKCYKCKLDSIQPKIPQMGQFPEDRITPFVRPFTYTGVDLCGPFDVAIGRRKEKRWVVVFTCLTIRAAHIELAHDLSTDAFILCLRNFINRRGTPLRIRSDNGTNFIGVQKFLKKEDRLINEDDILKETSNRQIEWLFNCPENPSSGGVWERLIQIIKRLLQKTLKESVPRVETLQSVLIEAENIINSRPLTEIPLSSEDDEPLTPNHFLIGCSNSTQTPNTEDEKLCLRKQWKISQNLKDRLWKRWITEYLPQLIRMTKWRNKTDPIKIGDLVLILESSVPRRQWLKGRIIKVFPAKDGQIRFAEIKTISGVKRRPVSKLAVFTTTNGESE
ncbi:uncharacterized protein LOC142231178 [Haematobia irritans]|uniref:uncharacterized protein LOC142231178 n=1 Tax=Haematobia irritans TaxID=7368 RepID=UPI003F50B7F5